MKTKHSHSPEHFTTPAEKPTPIEMVKGQTPTKRKLIKRVHNKRARAWRKMHKERIVEE